jgi:hypothetical protein
MSKQSLDLKVKRGSGFGCQTLRGRLVRYDDYGNMLYGACGTAFGFGQSRLLLAANVNQIMKLGFDDAHDVFNIKRGIQIYNNR